MTISSESQTSTHLFTPKGLAPRCCCCCCCCLACFCHLLLTVRRIWSDQFVTDGIDGLNSYSFLKELSGTWMKCADICGLCLHLCQMTGTLSSHDASSTCHVGMQVWANMLVSNSGFLTDWLGNERKRVVSLLTPTVDEDHGANIGRYCPRMAVRGQRQPES